MVQAILLFISVVTSYAEGNDPINDPYEAAIIAAEVSGLDDAMTAPGDTRKRKGASWLVATGLIGSRLTDLRNRKRSPYAGTAIHGGDAWVGKQNWHEGVKRGWLDPEHCVYHRENSRAKGNGRKAYDDWSTRGPYEAMMYNKYRFSPIPCFPVELMDVPLVNALLVSEAAIAMCKKANRHNQYVKGIRRRCDWKFLRCMWAGVARCKNNPEYRQKVYDKFARWHYRARILMRKNGDLPPLPVVVTPVEPVPVRDREPYIEEDGYEVPPPRPPEFQ